MLKNVQICMQPFSDDTLEPRMVLKETQLKPDEISTMRTPKFAIFGITKILSVTLRILSLLALICRQ
jgi:hypothetical protein